MKLSQLYTGALLAGTALAAPAGLEKRQNIDTTILQFALTLEHLENVFYEGALKNFTVKDFENAGFSADLYNNLRYIAHDENVHVQVLSAALQSVGVTPNAACQYSFPYVDVRTFITLSSVLEGVGTSAYLAGAPLITSKYYLTVAGSILVTEALHTSMQRGALGEVPMANPFGTPLDPTSVYTLAAMFITSCPSTNAPLPFTPFPTLNYDGETCTCEEPQCQPSQIDKRDPKKEPWGEWPSKNHEYCSPPPAGATIMLTAASNIPKGSYVTFVSGLSVVSVQGKIDGMNIYVTIPSVAMGQTYVFITKMDVKGSLVDSAVLFGPAIVEVDPPTPTVDFSIQK